MGLIQKLQQRNVFRVAIGYVVSCWLLAQVADLVLQYTTAPAWVMQVILLVMVLGFPVVVFFSWAYEVTPEGIKRESDVDPAQSITHVTGRKLDRAITAVLIIALGFFAYDRFVGTGAPAPVVVESTPGAPGDQPAAIQPDKSIAVLPFVNMSSDKEQDYFSDGLSEELLNLLAKVPDLRVIARTSSFAYKGKDIQIAQLARELNVGHVLEGSVRKSGNQVRITAQLIDARDSSHLWSETYDRTLDDIFAIQDEIANRIIAALLPQIVDRAGGLADAAAGEDSLYSPPVQVYQRYLLARNLFNMQSSTGLAKALELMTEMVREHPDYAEAQAFYALVVFSSSARTGGDVPWVEAEAASRNAIRKALALKPGLAEPYLVEGRLAQRNYDLIAAMASFDRAIELNPSYSDAYVALAGAAMRAGQLDRGWEALAQARALDPVSPLMLRTVASLATSYDRPEMAEEAMALLGQIAPETASELQVQLYWSLDEVARAAVQLENHRRRFPEGDDSDSFLAMLYAILGKTGEAGALSKRVRLALASRDGQKDLALQLMDELAAGKTDPHDRADIYWINYYYLGMYDEALSLLSELWYGYAEQTMGARMDTFDCSVFALLLISAGRSEEAQPVIRQVRDLGQLETRWWVRPFYDAEFLLYEGRVDEAVRLLHEMADKRQFFVGSVKPYENYLGIEQHPDYPALLAKYEAWRQGQAELYEALRAAEAARDGE